jgi:hypothetical protein
VTKTSAQLDAEIAEALAAPRAAKAREGISEGWYIEDELGTKHVLYGPFASKEAAHRAAYYRNAFAPNYEEKFLAGSHSPLYVDSDTARYLRDAPEDVFGKGAQVIQRPLSQVKIHPSWSEEWRRWKRNYPKLTYAAFQDRHWTNVWSKHRSA